MTATSCSDKEMNPLHTGEVVGSIPTAPTTHELDSVKDFPLLDAAYLGQKYETERKRTRASRGVDVDGFALRSPHLSRPARLYQALLITLALICAGHAGYLLFGWR